MRRYIQQQLISLCLISILAALGCEDANTPTNKPSPEATTAPTQPEITPPNPFQNDAPQEGLPASFTDHVPTYNNNEVDFKMVLIPGDEKQNIKPFYVAETEVTWDMFEYWMYGGDFDNANVYAEARSKGLRPSVLGHGHPQTDMGLIHEPRQPAIGMSWRVAMAYCRWLSEKTGKNYRLPTDNEWRYLLEQSGGVPAEKETLLHQAMFIDNADWDEFELFTKPHKVAQGKPDKLGLYDLIGNAAEWVQPMGGKRWVRGGHFSMQAEDFDADWLAVEDQSIWNEDYPAIPVSESWYLAHYYQGIRLVCAIEVPADQVRTKPVNP